MGGWCVVADDVRVAHLFREGKNEAVTATELADWLVKNLNIPFRDAHHLTGKIVKLAEKKACSLTDLSLKDLQTIEPKITKEIYQALDPKTALKNRGLL